MAQDYVLRTFEKSDFQDFHKNYWCTAVFQGQGEPVKWVVKDPMTIKEGETYYGEIREETNKKGHTYLRFYKKQRPEGAPASSNAPSERSGGYKDNSDGQRQGMCFNNATLFVNYMAEREATLMTPEDWANTVYDHAQALYLKGNLVTKAEHDVKASGLASGQDTVYDVAEEPINLNDIPF